MAFWSKVRKVSEISFSGHNPDFHFTNDGYILIFDKAMIGVSFCIYFDRADSFENCSYGFEKIGFP